MKRSGEQLVENPFKRIGYVYGNHHPIGQVHTGNFQTMFREMNAGPIDKATLRQYSFALDSHSTEKLWRRLYDNLNVWLVRQSRWHLMYLAIRLACDVPVLEAIHHNILNMPLSAIFLENLFRATPEKLKGHHRLIYAEAIGLTEGYSTKDIYKRMIQDIQKKLRSRL